MVFSNSIVCKTAPQLRSPAAGGPQSFFGAGYRWSARGRSVATVPWPPFEADCDRGPATGSRRHERGCSGNTHAQAASLGRHRTCGATRCRAMLIFLRLYTPSASNGAHRHRQASSWCALRRRTDAIQSVAVVGPAAAAGSKKPRAETAPPTPAACVSKRG